VKGRVLEEKSTKIDEPPRIKKSLMRGEIGKRRCQKQKVLSSVRGNARMGAWEKTAHVSKGAIECFGYRTFGGHSLLQPVGGVTIISEKGKSNMNLAHQRNAKRRNITKIT